MLSQKTNKQKTREAGLIFLLTALLWCFLGLSASVAAEPTTSVRVVKYATDKKTVAKEKVIDFRWMKKNLPVYGDGKTHYYHQGPVFEGDKWDPDRTKSLKDKGAVKGTGIKDLCELVGGMSSADEVVICAFDGYYVKLGYPNIYKPLPGQGPVVLCWYNGKEADDGERQGKGYVPEYYPGMRLVFMSEVPNPEGKYVFGNWDMRTCLKDEKYWHLYEEQYPSTNGLSAKWINEIRIYPGGAPDKPFTLAKENSGLPQAGQAKFSDSLLINIVYILLGLVVLTAIIYTIKAKRGGEAN
jgi:hypothetical protein